jgi:hypothetical protein
MFNLIGNASPMTKRNFLRFFLSRLSGEKAHTSRQILEVHATLRLRAFSNIRISASVDPSRMYVSWYFRSASMLLTSLFREPQNEPPEGVSKEQK